MIEILINDKKVNAEEGSTILQVVREQGISIPFPQRDIHVYQESVDAA